MNLGLSIVDVAGEDEWSWELHDDLLGQIRSHPAEAAYRRWRPIQDFFVSVFRPNYADLIGYLSEVHPDVAMEIMQNVREPVTRERFTSDLFRSLHNYLAAREALIDHGSTLVRLYPGTELEREFMARMRRIKGRQDSGILRGLRNQVLHEHLLSHGYRIDFHNNADGTQAESRVVV